MQDENDFRDSVFADAVVKTPSGYVQDQRAQHEDRLEAAEILEGLRALDSGGDGVRWSIARQGDPDPSRNGHLVTWATSQLDVDLVRDTFGGGKYYVKGRRSTGDYAGHKVIVIAGDAPRREGAGVVTQGIQGSGTPAGSFSEFLGTQERRDRERQERDDRRAERREQLILASLPAVATVFAAMFNRPQFDMAGLAAALKPAPAPDPLLAIAALKQLMPDVPRGPDPMQSAFKLVELLSDKTGGSDRTGWLDVVKEGVKVMGPTVGGAIEATIVQARANAHALQHGTGQPDGETGKSAVTALPAPQAAPVSTGDSSMLDIIPHVPWLREQLAGCVTAASKNRDPTLYAALFLEELPEGLRPERVLQLMTTPDWEQQLCRFDARIAQQIPWWTAMRDQLVTYIQESLEPDRPARKRASGEIERPTVLPSITGD